MATIHNHIRSGNNEQVLEYIRNHPDAVNAKDEKGFSALVLATYIDNLEITKTLIENGAEVNAKDGMGNTALMGVAFKGNLEIARLLLDHGADATIKNSHQMTALDYARQFKKEGMIKLLEEIIS